MTERIYKSNSTYCNYCTLMGKIKNLVRCAQIWCRSPFLLIQASLLHNIHCATNSPSVITTFPQYASVCFTCQVTTLGYTAPWELAPLLDSTPVHTTSFLNIGQLNMSETPHIFVASPRNSQSNFYVRNTTDEQVS